MNAIWLLSVFPLCMGYSASTDLVSMTIQNRVSIGLTLAFFASALLVGMPLATIGAHAAVAFFCLSVTFAMFAAGWMGGGDAKLLAATAIWFGPSALLLEYILVSAVFGGLLTAALLMCRFYLVPVTGIDFIDRLLEDETGVPYGIALGAAGLTVYSHSGWMDVAIKGLAASPF